MLPVIHIKATKKLVYFATVLYCGAFLAIMICALPWYLKLILLVSLFFNGKAYFCKIITLSHPTSICSFWKSSSQFWSLQQVNGQTMHAFLKKTSLITHFFVVLNFYTEDRRTVAVILTPEQVGRREFRQLLGHLYHSKHVSED